jgi:hypothetical protein
MKKIIFVLLLCISFTSCGMTLYSSTGYNSTYTTESTYGMYYHQYYYNGVYCPVLYVHTTPYYFYRDCWHVVPYVHYKHITYHRHGMRLRHHPPHGYRRHESRPPHTYNKHDNRHNPHYRPGGVSTQPTKPKPHNKPNVQPAQRPTHSGMGYRGNGQQVRPHNSSRNTMGSRPNSNRR